MKRLALAMCVLMGSAPALARESMGVFEGWGAFRDAAPSRCYAIGEPEEQAGGTRAPYVTISWWPEKTVRGQVHFRLRYDRKEGKDVMLQVGSRKWRLVAGASDAWSPSAKHDAFILAKIRESSSMTISATGPKGGRFVDVYPLKGGASAMDAAALGCAQPR